MLKYKLVLVGDAGVGKTALTAQFVYSRFVKKYYPTIEDLHKKEVEIDDVFYSLEIMDTAGKEEYSAMRDIGEGEGFLIVFSVHDIHSFEKVLMYRDHIMRVKRSQDVPMVLVGNKCDIPWKVDMDRARHLANMYNMPFFETSAKLRMGVFEAFHELVRLISLKRRKTKRDEKMECRIQ